MNWISVKERLPEANDWYIIYIPYGDGHYEVTCDQWESGEWRGWDNLLVTHWMPLPEPPEVK